MLQGRAGAHRITVPVSGSGAPMRRPSGLTFTLSRLVLAHEPRHAESSETADSLSAIRTADVYRLASNLTYGDCARIDGALTRQG